MLGTPHGRVSATAAVTSADGYTFLFGDLQTESGTAALLSFVKSYQAADYGLVPWRERAEAYLSNPKQVHWIVEVGTERARTAARETMRDVREAMGLRY